MKLVKVVECTTVKVHTYRTCKQSNSYEMNANGVFQQLIFLQDSRNTDNLMRTSQKHCFHLDNERNPKLLKL